MANMKSWLQKIKSFGGAAFDGLKSHKWGFLALGLAALTTASIAYWGDNAVSKVLSNIGEMIPHVTPKLFMISAGLCLAAIAARGIPALYRYIKQKKQHSSMRDDLSHSPCKVDEAEMGSPVQTVENANVAPVKGKKRELSPAVKQEIVNRGRQGG